MAVRDAVRSHDLAGARDIPAVTDARMRRSVNTMTPRPTSRWADRVPDPSDPEVREYLGELATLMDERRDRIGQHAAEHQPAWAIKALGPVPGDPSERERWQERASAIGAYRELFGHDDERQPIGAEPVADHPEKRALCYEAWRALGPADDTDLRDRTDGSLWLIRDQYQAETAWAPKHVGRELGYVRASTEDARLRVIRSRAEAEVARKAGDHELGAQHEQQAERSRLQESVYRMQESILAGLMDDRRAWEAATEAQRRLTVAADAELRRRNPEIKMEPLQSAEPDEVTDEQRTELDSPHQEQHDYQPRPGCSSWPRLGRRSARRSPNGTASCNRTKTPTMKTWVRRSRPGSKQTVTRCFSRPSRRSRRRIGSPSARPKLANPSYECHDGRGGSAADAASNVDDRPVVVPGHRPALA